MGERISDTLEEKEGITNNNAIWKRAMTKRPDPIVDLILYSTIQDDGFYRGYARKDNCLRCIRLGYEPVGVALDSKGYAFCDKCMQDLDLTIPVRNIMFGLRRTEKDKDGNTD
jgi:hypothetical protein